jgi:hypothetical protein
VANRADSFNYTANPIQDGTPSDGGADWVTPGATFITDGTVMAVSSGTEARLDCGATDHEAGVTMVAVANQTGVTCRGTAAGNDGYLLFRASGGGMTLYKLPAFDVLDTGGTSGNGDDIAVRAVGTTITGYVNGVEVVSATDSTHTTGTHGGVYSGNTYDDFYITDLTAGGGNRRRRARLWGGP